jgi:hypothetical protein
VATSLLLSKGKMETRNEGSGESESFTKKKKNNKGIEKKRFHVQPYIFI